MNESSLPVLLFALLVLTSGLPAAIDPYPTFGDRRIRFPDVPGYYTLKCDFHIHTIFSDGKVWPNMRVEEAVREGLDAIAITDHLEWNPHRADVPFPDQNRSYDIAVKAVEGRPLIVVRGAEITRRMPPEKDEPGHLNALFLQDANKLKQEDAFEVLKEARRQGAFVTWNHPKLAAADAGRYRAGHPAAQALARRQSHPRH
jgi:predicted metal-dependent phosphoesterase TrpH